MVEPCRFEDVFPIWRDQLWPGRQSPIESHSAMKWLGGIDMSLMSAVASFWQVRFAAGGSSAVLSGHHGGVIDATSVGLSSAEKSYRTRGLWVPIGLRRQGTARKLMEAAFDQARRENCSVVWTFPRESSMAFYQSMGFSQVGAMIGSNDPLAGEFGPNCYAIAKL